MPEGSNIRTVEMPMAHHQALFLKDTAQADSRTIELVWYTGARVQRYNWWTDESYDLEFAMDEKSCDLSRLNNGAPVIDSHDTTELSKILGVVEKAWIKDGQGHALVRFSTRPDVEPIWNDVKNGIIRNVSMGAAVTTYEITKQEGKSDLWRAIEWQPMEISLCAVQADQGAGTRLSANRQVYPCRLQLQMAPTLKQKETKMSEENTPAAEPAAETPAAAPAEIKEQPAAEPASEPSEATPAPTPAPAGDAALSEQTRCLEIQRACRAMNLQADVAESLIKSNVSLDAARTRILNLAVEAAEAAQVKATPSGGAPSNSNLSLEDAVKQEWDKDENLRKEFAQNFNAYLSYKKAEADGRTKLVRKA